MGGDGGFYREIDGGRLKGGRGREETATWAWWAP